MEQEYFDRLTDDEALQELEKRLERKRIENGVTELEPTPLEECLKDPPDVDAKREEWLKEREKRQELEQKYRRWESFIEDRGIRYRPCRLSNFVVSGEQQAAVLAAVEGYATRIVDEISIGTNVILFGPKGTGKDHLLTALSHMAFGHGFTVEWRNGVDLYGDMRDSIAADMPEKDFVDRLVRPNVLYLSDPLPPVGAITNYQSSMLLRILDARYSRARPTWCSVNVLGGDELDQRMAGQNADRLRDGALALYCNWPSYRKVRA